MDGDEASLVAALRQGDPLAFDRAYECFAPRLFRFLARLAGRRDLAEDLVQESFLRLSRRAGDLREDTKLAAWLFTVGRNLYRSHRRWTLLDRDRLAVLAHQPVRPSPRPDDEVQARETERRLEDALAALAPAYREAILLSAIERLEPTDAAAVVGLKPDAFRQRLSRARGMLKQALRRGESEVDHA